ncbi:MAG: FKBP-type peptidyl-prolyl cis-trans isomerase [Myxococcota bacterium]
MRASLGIALLLVLGALPLRASGGGADNGELETREQKIVYALGLSLAQFLEDFELDEQELGVLVDGLSDATLGREPKVSPSIWTRRIEGFRKQRVEQARTRMQKLAAEFLTRAATRPEAVRKPSGLIYTEIEGGTGPNPQASDRVTVSYHGTRTDGTVFDSSRDRGQHATFALDGVIPCWTEGLQLMKVGGKSELVCPPDLAYGDTGVQGSIRPGSVLSFEVELLEIPQR